MFLALHEGEATWKYQLRVYLDSLSLTTFTA